LATLLVASARNGRRLLGLRVWGIGQGMGRVWGRQEQHHPCPKDKQST